MDTDTRRDMSDTDPALDALAELDDIARRATGLMKGTAQAAIVHDALADRVTSAEARLLVPGVYTADDLRQRRALIARLGRIADRDEEAGR
jgi:hypothetical protein